MNSKPMVKSKLPYFITNINFLFIKVLIEADHINNLLDCFISGNMEDVADIIKDETGKIADIEKTIRKVGKYFAELVM